MFGHNWESGDQKVDFCFLSSGYLTSKCACSCVLLVFMEYWKVFYCSDAKMKPDVDDHIVKKKKRKKQFLTFFAFLFFFLIHYGGRKSKVMPPYVSTISWWIVTVFQITVISCELRRGTRSIVYCRLTRTFAYTLIDNRTQLFSPHSEYSAGLFSPCMAGERKTLYTPLSDYHAVIFKVFPLVIGALMIG